MAMLINNPSTEKEKIKKERDLEFSSFSILGFQIGKTSDNTVADFYFLFFDKDKDPYIIRHSYLLKKERMDDEMAYFNHPIHQIINMKKYTGAFKEKIDKIFEEFSHNNSYYSDFKPISITDEKATFELVNITIDTITHYRTGSMSIGDYLKIQTIVNNITFHRPINTSIDRDISYYNCEIVKDQEVNYIGSQCLDMKNGEFFAFFSLSNPNSIKKIGVAVPVITTKDNILVKDTNNLDVPTFGTMYKENYMVDASKLLLLPVPTDDGFEYKVAINLLLAKAKRKLIITDESILDSKLFNPIKLMFSE